MHKQQTISRTSAHIHVNAKKQTKASSPLCHLNINIHPHPRTPEPLTILPLTLPLPLLLLKLTQIALPHRPHPRRPLPLPLHLHLNQRLHLPMITPPHRLPQAPPPLQIRAELVLAQLDGLPRVPGEGERRGVAAVLFAAVVGHEFFGDGVDDAVGLAQVVDPDADFLQPVGFGAVVGGPVYGFGCCRGAGRVSFGGCFDVGKGEGGMSLPFWLSF